MIYRTKNKQVSYGEDIGILLIENYAPFIPGDVANATSFQYPVRFEKINGLTVERIFSHDMSILNEVKKAALNLQAEGVRAITGNCGFLLLYQSYLKETLKIPVFLSSLLQIPFIEEIIGNTGKLGIITANSDSLTDELLNKINIQRRSGLVIEGLQNAPHFKEAVLDEKGWLDSELIEKEVVLAATEMISKNPEIEAILLECSVLPPYAARVSEVTGLPVFDFITMIDYVHSAVVKKDYNGHM